jgi:gas vesicle protein
MKYTPAVLLGIATVTGVIFVSGKLVRERFEDKNEEEKKEEKEKKDDEPEPHMDMGTTIMNAYKRMKPEQVQQMQEDTKELMETQRQLMDTISMLGPQVQQGAELVKTFQGMFGGNLSDVLKQ